MSLVSTPSLGSISVAPTTPRNQGKSISCSSNSPTPQVSTSTFETYESLHEGPVSSSSSSGHEYSIVDFPRAIAAAPSQGVTFPSPLSVALDNPATLSWSRTWEIEQGLVDDAGEPELPDDRIVYSAEEARAEEHRRRLLWSSPLASKILRRQGFIPPPSPPPEICSTRLRGTSRDKDDKVATTHGMAKRKHVAFPKSWM